MRDFVVVALQVAVGVFVAEYAFASLTAWRWGVEDWWAPAWGSGMVAVTVVALVVGVLVSAVRSLIRSDSDQEY